MLDLASVFEVLLTSVTIMIKGMALEVEPDVVEVVYMPQFVGSASQR